MNEPVSLTGFLPGKYSGMLALMTSSLNSRPMNSASAGYAALGMATGALGASLGASDVDAVATAAENESTTFSWTF